LCTDGEACYIILSELLGVFLFYNNTYITGSTPADSTLENMVKEAPGNQFNFTAFLSLFSDKIAGE